MSKAGRAKRVTCEAFKTVSYLTHEIQFFLAFFLATAKAREWAILQYIIAVSYTHLTLPTKLEV